MPISHKAAGVIRLYSHCPKKWLSVFHVMVSFCLLTYLIFKLSNIQLSSENIMENKLVELKLQLKFLQSLYRVKKDSLQRLQRKLQLKYGQSTMLSTFPDKTSQYATSIRGSRTAEGLNFTYDLENVNLTYIPQLLPHLLENPHSVRPAYYLESSRMFVDVVVGVPSIKRDKESYLLTTLDFLISGLREEDLNSTLIIIYIGETDLEYVLRTAREIEIMFPKHIKSGLIEILSPSIHFYPDFDTIQPTLGDSLKRMKWRSKQNLDALFLMTHARTRGTFYLMLEDDVIAKKDYLKVIKEQIIVTDQTSPEWFLLDFSKVGGIGKLFKSSDLLQFITYIQIFYADKPLDWLISSFLSDKVCTIEMNSKNCWKNINEKFSKKLPSLFKHIGLFSSLKGKVHKIPERIKKLDIINFYPHTNPNVEEILSDIRQEGPYSVRDAYEGNNFFWGKTPKANNFILFKFAKPTRIQRYLIRSGNVQHTSDKFYNTAVEIIPEKNKSFIEIGTFDEFGIAEGEIDKKHGNLEAIRLRVKSDSRFWVIISEIELVSRNSTK